MDNYHTLHAVGSERTSLLRTEGCEGAEEVKGAEGHEEAKGVEDAERVKGGEGEQYSFNI